LSPEDVRDIYRKYQSGSLTLTAALAVLKLGRTRFFELLGRFRTDPDRFTLTYCRTSPKRISGRLERRIAQELRREQRLVEDPTIPITRYNYSAVRDAVLKTERSAPSLHTIIARAKDLGCWTERPPRAIHDRIVVTTYPGQLLQHDTSIHRWSPFVSDHWRLVTTLDDHSRKLLHAELVERETTWTHICALKSVILRYGIPLAYYVDNLAVFRFVRSRDTVWKRAVLKTDDATTQWQQVCADLGIDVKHALSPQAKGKIERPFRWLQDRIVRRAYHDRATTLNRVRELLCDEVERYNEHQVHSVTKETPSLRFARLSEGGRSCFRTFSLPKPYTDLDDVFCLRERRVVDEYRRISFGHRQFAVSGVLPRETISLRITPDPDRGTVRLRLWHSGRICGEYMLLAKDFPAVHF
jgi:hypothetical protein